MSLPYLPGWGDVLANTLPQIGKDLSNIINPDQENERKLMQLMQANPGLIDELRAQEKANPGSTRVFGKHAQRYIAGGDTTPEYKVAQESKKEDLAARKKQNVLNDEQIRKIIEQHEIMGKIAANDRPYYDEIMKDRTVREATGSTPDELALTKYHVEESKRISQGRKDAEEFAKSLGGDPKKMYDAIYGDKPTADLTKIGSLATHPQFESFKRFVDQQFNKDLQDFTITKNSIAEEGRNKRAGAALNLREQAEISKNERERNRLIGATNTRISVILGKTQIGAKNRKPLNEEQAQPILAELNRELDVRNQLTGEQYEAVWVDQDTWDKRFKAMLPGGGKARSVAGIVYVDYKTGQSSSTAPSGTPVEPEAENKALDFFKNSSPEEQKNQIQQIQSALDDARKEKDSAKISRIENMFKMMTGDNIATPTTPPDTTKATSPSKAEGVAEAGYGPTSKQLLEAWEPPSKKEPTPSRAALLYEEMSGGKYGKYKKSVGESSYKGTGVKFNEVDSTEINTPAARNNNPGNLRVPDSSNKFMRFKTPEEGFLALVRDVELKQKGHTRTGLSGDSTLLDFVRIYAPASDSNDVEAYVKFLTSKLGVNQSKKIGEIPTRALAEAIAEHEDSKFWRALNE